jgi:hypothetical protein
LTDCLHTGKEKAILLLSKYKKKIDTDKKKANFKTLGNSGATAGNRDGQTTYLTAENLGVKVTVLADTGSDYSAVPRSAVENGRKHGFPLKVKVLPDPIMLNMAIRGENNKKKCSAKEMLMSALTITTPSGHMCMRGERQIIVEEDMEQPLIGLGRDGIRGESASRLCTGLIPLALLQSHWRRAIGYGQAASGRTSKASTQAFGHSRVY